MGRPGGEMIFIVDDDQAVRHSLTLLLASEGLQARSFASAREFLATCKPSSDDRLIVDVDMPGMNGIELLLRLRDGGVAPRSVVITGNPSSFLRQQALAAGAMAFLEKPIDTDRLVTLVRDGEAAAP
jgi:two-component system, LuxR family, response regulator FixJ